MSVNSSLGRYLKLVQSQGKQIEHAVPEDPDEEMTYLNKRGKRVVRGRPPKSDALHALLRQAYAEVNRQDPLSRLALKRLNTLHRLQVDYLDVVNEHWNSGCLRNRTFFTARTNVNEAWRKLNELLLGIETGLAAGKTPEIPEEHTKSPSSNGITFDEKNRKVTINGVTYPPIEDFRAYRLFKIVAEAGGEIVSRKTIVTAINALKGKNTMATTKKRLPKPLQWCLLAIKGREGGYSYREPRQRK